MDENYHSLGVREVLKQLNSQDRGLTKEEAKKRLEEFGYNELQREKRTTPLKIILSQFKNALILLLLFACGLSIILGEIIESIAIIVIILINTVLGFIQEYRAEKAVEALEKLSAPKATVLRDGKEERIPAREVVPGDILLIEAGDIIPADSRIISVSSLQIDEASLTGESLPSKKVTTLFKPETSIADQENMAFMGTVVTYGKGKSVVTNTGMRTEFGKIAKSIQSTKEVKTPLQTKFEQLAKQIGIVAVSLIIIVLIFGAIQGTLSFTQMVLFALILMVSTIPSALPVVVTISLSNGARALAKKNMIIKKLPAAESLGSATIICSDKTGTITKNEMTITNIFTENLIIKVSGTGYDPKGEFSSKDKSFDPKKIELLLKAGHLCNNSKLVEEDHNFKIIGDPTEGSLVVLSRKGGIDDSKIRQDFELIEELPFDSDRKRMAMIFKNKENKKTEAYVKGAPDLLLKVCDRIFDKGKIRKLTAKDKETILKMNNNFAEDALRVLALAYKDVSSLKKYNLDSVEKNLVFIGLVGMIDPPREGVKAAIEQCTLAGIKVMIITGDHAITTKAVAKQIGLFQEKDLILTGDELELMSDEELEQKIEQVRIVARALPIQKLRIVDALQKKGHIVAMTGDGVNDAPALKKANIGIAMGITGSDVAKEVSEATLADDNFATIVNAIGEGRNIYDKMIKSAKYLLSCNTGEIATVFIAVLLRLPLPLIPLQLLLINLLTDSSPASGLGFERAEQDIMSRKPRDPKDKPITNKMFISILCFGLVMGLGTLFMFMQYKNIDLVKAQTVAFTTLVIFQMFAVISSRTLYPSIKSLNPFSNLWLLGAVCLSILIQVIVIYWPPLQSVFGTSPLQLTDWIKIIAVSSLGFILMELSKFFMKHDKEVSIIQPSISQ